MVDWQAHKKAHKLEICPACDGMMRLGGDTYTCEKCGHFEQDPSLQDIVERDDPANLKFCSCEYCLKELGSKRLLGQCLIRFHRNLRSLAVRS